MLNYHAPPERLCPTAVPGKPASIRTESNNGQKTLIAIRGLSSVLMSIFLPSLMMNFTAPHGRHAHARATLSFARTQRRTSKGSRRCTIIYCRRERIALPTRATPRSGVRPGAMILGAAPGRVNSCQGGVAARPQRPLLINFAAPRLRPDVCFQENRVTAQGRQRPIFSSQLRPFAATTAF